MMKEKKSEKKSNIEYSERYRSGRKRKQSNRRSVISIHVKGVAKAIKG